MMALLQTGGALQSDYFSIISKVSPHDQVFKFYQPLEDLGINGIQLSIDLKERERLKDGAQAGLQRQAQQAIDPNDKLEINQQHSSEEVLKSIQMGSQPQDMLLGFDNIEENDLYGGQGGSGSEFEKVNKMDIFDNFERNN